MNKFARNGIEVCCCALSNIVSTLPYFLLMLTILLPPQSASAAEFNFLHEQPGKISVSASASPDPGRIISKSDAVAYKRNLERLRDLLLRQPVFNPPLGVEIRGYMRPNDQLPATKKVPIPGFGYLRFHFYALGDKTNKPFAICCTTDEIYLSVNDPGQGFDSYSAVMFPTRAMYEPQQVGEMAGFPVYRLESGNEVIMLSRKNIPFWIPLTREEYVKAWLASWEKHAAGSPPEDTITPEIVRRHREVLAAMLPDERKMQARTHTWDPFEPTLAPVDSDEGKPLVRVNPVWFDASLPRAAFQLITLRFDCGSMNHEKPGPTEFGDIAPYRVWQSLHTSDWKEIGGALTGK